MWAGKPSEGGIGTAHFNYDTFFVLAIELEPCGCAVSRNNGSLSIGSQDPNYRERLSRGGLYVDDPFFVVGRTAVVYKDMVTGVHRFRGKSSPKCEIQTSSKRLGLAKKAIRVVAQ